MSDIKPCAHCGLADFSDVDRKNKPPVVFHPYVPSCPFSNRTVNIESWNTRAQVSDILPGVISLACTKHEECAWLTTNSRSAVEEFSTQHAHQSSKRVARA